MTDLQKKTWIILVEACRDNRYATINVAGVLRRETIIAVDDVLNKENPVIVEKMEQAKTHPKKGQE